MNFFLNVVIQTNDLTKDDVYYKSGRRHLLLYSRGDIRHITLDTYYLLNTRFFSSIISFVISATSSRLSFIIHKQTISSTPVK